MADIKTRDRLRGTIKTIDKAYVAGQHMKRAYISTKDKAEHSTYSDENSADEYAADRFEQGVDTAVHEGVRLIDRAGRKGVDVTKKSVGKANDAVRNFKVKHSENASISYIKTVHFRHKYIKKNYIVRILLMLLEKSAFKYLSKEISISNSLKHAFIFLLKQSRYTFSSSHTAICICSATPN